jgi:hypothetical protein
MGGFSIFHWLIVFAVFALPIVLIIRFASAKARRPPSDAPVAQRLLDLDDLLRRGLISADEHRRRRADIINGV